MNAPTSRSRQTRHHDPQSIRGGFTLIEMLIVIVIILILMSLLVAAVGGAMTKARIAQVRTEISSLENAIADFKSVYGIEPPSSIWLFESGADGADGGSNDWDDFTSFPIAGEVIRSRTLITRMWSKFNFSLNRDINNDGTVGGAPLYLTGAECLVFFLGGYLHKDGAGGTAPVGFSKNPANPFMDVASPSETRSGPFHEFNSARLVDVDSDSTPEYLDTMPSQTAPFLYLTSYDGRGYRISEDVNRNGSLDVGEDLNANSTIDPLDVAVYPDPLPPPPQRNLLDVYRQGDLPTSTPYKSKSYMLISPGMPPHVSSSGVETPYGVGGAYNPEKWTLSEQDGDNITNFTQGRMK